MKHFFSSIVFLALLGLMGCWSDDDENVIRIATSPDYPPFEYKENGELAGFDIELAKLIGKELSRDVKKEDFFYDSDLSNELKILNKFNFGRPWGVPVRYHDFANIKSTFNSEVYEFHLSFSDMELNVNDYFDDQIDADFIVHAPELFMKSHLLDLASLDQDYRQVSIEQMNRVCEITRSLNKFFPSV